MGMSASQARLIALTARMSDTEYEAQQINQQRLTLSNKMNEVYEMMCNMEVPTPPAKIDFAKDNYEGRIGGDKITVSPDSSGVLKAFKEVSGSVVNTTKGIKGGVSQVSLAAAQVPAGTYNPQAYVHPLKAVVINPADSNYQDYINTHEIGTKTDELVGYDDDGTPVYKYEYDQPVVTEDYEVDESSWAGPVDVESFKYEQDSSIEPKFYISNDGEATSCTKEEFKNTYFGGYDEATITSMCSKYFVPEEGGARLLTPDDFTNGKLNEGLTILEKSTTGETYTNLSSSSSNSDVSGTVTSADGKKAGVVASISSLESDEKFQVAFQALKNTNSTKSEDELKAAFDAVAYDDGSFAFILKTDYADSDNSVFIYEVGTGTYQQQMKDGDYQITYDNSGNVNGLTTTAGGQTALNTVQAYDEVAYDSAMASYTAEKMEYDQEQNRLNKQTSIYQRQDKQLEMKLTRLDNERNALNTELEAVKKVIQDAIDRGFKTFSG